MKNKHFAGIFIAVFAGMTHAFHSVRAYAEPAVFFNPDLDAGRTRFKEVIQSTDAASGTPEIFELNLSSATTSGGLYSVTGTKGSTTYVRLSLKGAQQTEADFSGAGGILNDSVSISNTGLAGWDEAVDEGFKVEFFSDSVANTPVSMNALGMEVNDWGTCCFASIDNNGDPSP